MTVVTFAPFQSTAGHPALGTRGHAGSERQHPEHLWASYTSAGFIQSLQIRSNATGTVVLVDQVTKPSEDPLPRGTRDGKQS